MKIKKDIIQRHWYLRKHHIILCNCGALTHAATQFKAPLKYFLPKKKVKKNG